VDGIYKRVNKKYINNNESFSSKISGHLLAADVSINTRKNTLSPLSNQKNSSV
jgi:hypothetical protein